MIISEISYHLVLITNIRDYFEPKMKSDLAIIIPDVLAEYGCALERIAVSPDRVYLYITASPKYTPVQIAEAVATNASIRIKRLHKKLDGFNNIFREDYYFKTGKKPTKAQLDDFIKIVKEGI